MNFLTSEFLDMTYPDKYYQDVINPAKTGKGQVPSKMQMLSKAQPFKAMRIGIDPYLPKSMQTGYDAFRAAPTTGAARFLGSNIAGGLPALYGYGAGKLQKNIPEELQGIMSEDIISQGAMGAGAGQDEAWDTILRGSTTGVPEGIMKAGGFQENVSDPSVMQPHDWEFGDQWQTAKEDSSALGKIKNYFNPARVGASAVANKLGLGWAAGIPGLMFSGLTGGIGNFANTMRGGLTQRGYKQARDARKRQSRIDYMLDRRAQDKGWGVKNLNQLTMGSRPGFYDNVPTYDLPQKQPKPISVMTVPVPAHIRRGGNGGNNQPSGGFSGAGAGTGSRGPRS